MAGFIPNDPDVNGSVSVSYHERKIIDRIVMSDGAPGTYDLWLDLKTNTFKVFVDGEWKTIGGGSASSSS